MESSEIVVSQPGELSPGSPVDRAVELLATTPDVGIATLVVPIREISQLDDSNCVKVVMDARGRALYLSRKRIPYVQEPTAESKSSESPRFYRWLRQTVYRRGVLSKLAKLPVTPLEKLEGIDLLRALEHGFPIAVVVIDESEAVAIGRKSEVEAWLDSPRS